MHRSSIQCLYNCRSCNGLLFIYVILVFTTSLIHGSRTPPCGLYGAPPCQFLPAPPGQTPTCARPGKTYCEHIDNYPLYLIKRLVQKWGYEARNLLVDETWEDFAAVAWHETPVFYDPKSIFPSRDFHNGDINDFNGYSYHTPPYGSGSASETSATAGISTNSLFISKPIQQQTTDAPTPTYLLYTSAGQRLKSNGGAGGGGNGNNQLYYNKNSTPYNATLWLKRIARDLSEKYASSKAKPQNSESKKDGEEGFDEENEAAEKMREIRSTRDVSINMDLLDIVGVENKKSRMKRQSPGRTSLCQTTSQFITPQAALNSRGNWMFVVNEANTARQMVKAELCASNTCSNLCELPNGYNSRCEQKFVQKRLIALQGNGQNLYTDTFWFPSCCVCTIAAN